MTQINTNVMSMLAQRSLGLQNQGLDTSLERLSTGLRINRGADDPAGLIASENLRSEKTAISSAISNAERADQVMNIAEGGLTEVSSMLNELQGLVTQSANDAGLSAEEKQANQMQIDSILQTIDRVADSTSFQGQKLLNGNFSYQTENVDSSELADVKIDSARVPDAGQIDVTVDVQAAAHKARVAFDAATMPADAGSFTLEVGSNNGSVAQITIAENSDENDIATAINNVSEITGVSAEVDGTDVVMSSEGYGSSESVSVTKVQGDAGYDDRIQALDDDGAKIGSPGNSATAQGYDADVLINGQQAQVDGLDATINSANLAASVSIAEAMNDDVAATGPESSEFAVTGGGANFQLSPDISLAGRVSMGIDAVTTGRLGSNGNGFLAEMAAGQSANVVDGDLGKAQSIVEDAISQVSSLRGRIGSFQSNTVGSTVRALGVAMENTAAAESQIRDTDFAEETAALTRNQILSQAAMNSLQLANSQPQNVLALLG